MGASPDRFTKRSSSPDRFVRPAENGGGGISSIVIEDEGVNQGNATTLDFEGSGVTATVVGDVATIVIPGATVEIPQLDTDPVAPDPETAWVLKQTTGGAGGGELKFLFGGGTAITAVGAAVTTYQFSYRTLEGITIREQLTVAPPAPGWATSNLINARTLDANSSSLDHTNDVLGTLIEDLLAQGVISP